jgi:hypothetical protein
MNFKSILALGLGIATLSLSLPAVAKDQATPINPADFHPGKVADDRNPKPPAPPKGSRLPPAKQNLIIIDIIQAPNELPTRKLK